MTAALPPENYIHEGVWINWLKGGRVLGATLTVNPSAASILSPALALIISIAGSQLWRLFQFGLHQSRATNQENNFLYHQQQITLRNTATDLNTLWRLIRLAFAWRRHTDIKVIRQSLPLVVWTTSHLILVMMAGLFSSWLLRASDQVLSRSQWCGKYTTAFTNDAYSADTNDPDVVVAAFEYNNHMNSRYAFVQQNIDICQNFGPGCISTAISNLTYNSTVLSGECPFAGSICHSQNESIRFDTGYLSSAAHLGFNAINQDRISFRMVAECAPLDDARHVTGWHLVNATSEMPAHEVSDAHYGPGQSSARNSTFSFTKQYMECQQRGLLPPYVLDSEWCPAGGNLAAGTSTFDPIPELQQSDVDLSLVMLMVNSLYDSPVTDPWFTAQLPTDESDAYCMGTQKLMYTRETPLTTMACKQQWQICNTDSLLGIDSAKCTKLQGITQTWNDFFKHPQQLRAQYNSRQLATVSRFIRAASQSSFYSAITALGQTSGAPIKARSLVSATSGISPPPTQWQNETRYWMDILLGYLQQNSLDLSSGQFAFDTKYINVTTPTSDTTGSAYEVCRNQIIHSKMYHNFNFFALVLCVSLCIIITILGLSIEDMIAYIRQHRITDTKPHEKQDMWIVNSDLEMLRTLIEVKKNIQWRRSSFGIPFAPVGEKAGIEDLRSDVLEAKAGHGIINKNVQRRQTATKLALSPERRRAYSHGAHSGHKSCATCESFETFSPIRDDPSDKNISTTYADIQNDQSERPRKFYFANEISVDASQSDTSLLRATTPSRPTIQTHRTNRYEMVYPNDSTEVDAITRIQPFHYRDRSLVSGDTSSDSLDEKRESGHSTPIRYDEHGQSRSDISLSGHNGQSSFDRSNNNLVGRRGGFWPRLRRDDSSGTIC